MAGNLTNREILDLLADADPNEVRDVLVRFLRYNAKPHAVPPHCPECGTNIRADHILELDGFFIDPRGEVRYRGRPIALSPKQLIIFHTVAQNAGRFVSARVLVERCGTESSVWSKKTLQVQIHYIREKLETAEAPDPLNTGDQRKGSFGYRWKIEKDRSVASRAALSLSGGVGAAETQSVGSQAPESSQGSSATITSSAGLSLSQAASANDAATAK